ncbi:MAG: hypothetical protein M1285_02545 [Candidatus Thermoplasmatota archaeon]|jgi:hypothetical protein|nr:hypothetical protein [Candidatus Thermoplasmatota archaeon]
MTLPEYLGNEAMYSRLNLLKDDIRLLHSHPDTTRFVSIAGDALTKTAKTIEKAAVTNDKMAKDGFMAVADKVLRDLSEDASLFFMFENSLKNKKWKPLTNLSNRCSEYMGLKRNPSVVLYGSSNFSASGPSNMTGRLKLEGETYSLVVIDHSLDALLWPSVVHEIAHLLPSIDELVDNLYYRSGLSKRVNIDEGISKLTEAVCDSLATSIMGPSYPLSFYAQYYQIFGQGDYRIHPTDEFRMKLMTEILRSNNLKSYADSIDKLLTNRSRNSWKNDVLANYIDEIISGTRNVVIKKSDVPFRRGMRLDDFVSGPPRDIYSLFNEGWSLVLSHYDAEPQTYNKISKKIFDVLKGETVPLYPPA